MVSLFVRLVRHCLLSSVIYFFMVAGLYLCLVIYIGLPLFSSLFVCLVRSLFIS